MPVGAKDKLIPDEVVNKSLLELFTSFEEANLHPNVCHNSSPNLLVSTEMDPTKSIFKRNFKGKGKMENTSHNHSHQKPTDEYAENTKLSPQNLYQQNLRVMEEKIGFVIERQASVVEGGGRGVKVTKGTIPAGTVVAMYPGG